MFKKSKKSQLPKSSFSKYFMIKYFLHFFNSNKLFFFISYKTISCSYNSTISSMSNYINVTITYVNYLISTIYLKFFVLFNSKFPIIPVISIRPIHINNIFSYFIIHFCLICFFN